MDPLEIMRRPNGMQSFLTRVRRGVVRVHKRRRRIVAEEEEEARVAAVHLAENYGNNNFVLTLPVSPFSFCLPPIPVGRHWKPEVRAAVTGIARPKLRNSLGNRSSRQTRRKLKAEQQQDDFSFFKFYEFDELIFHQKYIEFSCISAIDHFNLNQ